jgi:hypothetical protein
VETLTTVAMATDKHATMEATSVFYVVWPQPARNSRMNCCFLRGPARHNNVEVFSLGSGPEAI